MRVLLVNPALVPKRLGSYGRFATSVPPTGLCYLASVLRRDGFEVRVYDQHAARASNDPLMAIVESWRPAVVGFSTLTFVLETVEDASRRIHARFPDTRVVVGNIHATYFPHELLGHGIADYVVREEGEVSFLELCRSLRDGREPLGVAGLSLREGGRIVDHPAPPLVDLETLPYPAWDLLAGYSYDPEPMGLKPLRSATQPLPIQGSRGCPFACTFCSQETVYRKVRVRPTESVVDEMEWVHRTYGTEVFGFIDAIFPLSFKQGHAFADDLIRRGLHKKLRWFTETRVDLVDRDLLAHLKEAGLTFIQFGIESGDDDVLAEHMNKRATVEEARRALRWTRELGILTFGLFVVGMPFETRDQILRTIRLAKELDPDIVKFNVAVPFPGSAMWEQYKHRIGDQPSWKYSGWYDANLNDSENILAGDTLPTRELMYLQRRAMFEFYARPTVVWRYLTSGLVSLDVLGEGFYVMMSDLVKSAFGARRARVEPMPTELSAAIPTS